MTARPRGRPRKHAEYEALVKSFKKGAKRPAYEKGIGVFVGAKNTTAWVRITLPHGGSYKGRSYAPGERVEIKVGSLSSFSWDDLEQRRDDFQEKADKGEPLEDDPVSTFGDYADRWLEHFQGKDNRTVKSHIGKHFKPAFGSKRMDALERKHVNDYIARRLKEAAASTVKRELESLGSIFQNAVREGIINDNPARYVNKAVFKRIDQREVVLSLEQEKVLLAKAEEVAEWLPDFIRWAVYSGMRKAEILNLKWSDLKKENGVMMAHLPETKTNKKRDVPCRSILLDVLERQKGRKARGNDHVFPITPQVLRTRWKAALIAAGLTEVVGWKEKPKGDPEPIHKALLTIHDLRRSCATRLIDAGVDPLTVAAMLGWSDLKMLKDRYYAPTASIAGARAMDKLASYSEGEASEELEGVVGVKAEPEAEGVVLPMSKGR